MKEGIVVTTKEFTDLNKRVVTYMRKQGHKLTDWCKKTIHPTDGRLVFRTTQKIEPILTSAEKSEIFELGDDWVPKAETL